MSKRKRNSASTSRGANQGDAGAGGRVSPNQQRNVTRDEAMEIDLTGDDDDNENVGIGGHISPPKKKKLELNDDLKRRAENLRGRGRTAIDGGDQPPDKPSNSARSTSGNKTNSEKFVTAPDITPQQDLFKLPSVPVPSASRNCMTPIKQRQKKVKKSQPLTQKEQDVTNQARKLRVAIIEVFHDELEKIANDELAEINSDTLVENLTSCVNLFPNIYATHRFPQIKDCDDRSKEWELLEFARWWFFGLTALFFSAPDMKQVQVRENIKRLLRTLCQYLCKGHPTLIIDAYLPQLFEVLRDLSVRGKTNCTAVVRIRLSRTQVEEDKKKTRITRDFNVKVNETNEWAIPHYIESISILFPIIYFYNWQYRHVLVELLQRLFATVSPNTSKIALCSTLRAAVMPTVGFLTEEAIAKFVHGFLTMSSNIDPHQLEITRKMFNRCNSRSWMIISQDSGAGLILKESSHLLYSKDLAKLYQNDDNKAITSSFEWFFEKSFRGSLSSEAVKAAEIISENGETLLDMVLHPSIERVIVKELSQNIHTPHGTSSFRSATLMSSSSAQTQSELLSRITFTWKKAIDSEIAITHDYETQTQTQSIVITKERCKIILKFLKNTAVFMKLIQNVIKSVGGELCRGNPYCELQYILKWAEVVFFALKNMSLLDLPEQHELYTSVLDTMESMDFCDWFKAKLSPKHCLNILCIAGWPWIKKFESKIPKKFRRFPEFTNYDFTFITSSQLLYSKAVKMLRLELFRPWMHFVAAVYSGHINDIIRTDCSRAIDNTFFEGEILSGIASVNWAIKKIRLYETFLVLDTIVKRKDWIKNSFLRSILVDAIVSLPCLCSSTYQSTEKNASILPKSGCSFCCGTPCQEEVLKDVDAQKIIALASPILQSMFTPAKLRLTELITSRHMKNPSAVVAIPMLTVAINGRPSLCQEIFKKYGTLLVEDSSEGGTLENGCLIRIEVATKLFRVALPNLCRTILLETKKKKLPLPTRMKIVLGIVELTACGPISLSVFVEIFNFLILLLSQTTCHGSDMAVILGCQKIVTNLAEMYKCRYPMELITRIRISICPQLIKVCNTVFYNPRMPLHEQQEGIAECSSFIDRFKMIASFTQLQFTEYYQPYLVEQIISKLHVNKECQFLVSALARQASVMENIVLQESIFVWYPSLLINSTADEINICLESLRETYKFDPAFVAIEQEQKILNEALCYLHDRKTKVLRSLVHLCSWSEGGDAPPIFHSQPISRSATSELLDKKMHGFFLHMDTKLKSPLITVELKKKLLKSVVVLIQLMGKGLAQLRSKIYQMLNFMTDQGCHFYDVVLEGWRAFANSLEGENFSSMSCPILAALLPLLEDSSLKRQVEGVISHFVCFKSELTKPYYPKMYFLLDYCEDTTVKTKISQEVDSVKAKSWLDFFNILVEEANHTNSHIRYQAFCKLHEVLKSDSDHFEKHVLARGQQNVSRVVSTLLGGLRGSTGDNPEDKKMQLLIAKCFGCLGALDPIRFTSESKYGSRNRAGLVVNPQINNFCVYYLQELMRVFHDTKDGTIFDYCVCLIQNLCQEFNIKTNSQDPVWSRLSLSVADQEIIKHMLLTKYAFDVEERLPAFASPIYLSDHGKSFETWLLNWLTVLIEVIKENRSRINNSDARKLFVKNMTLLRKNARIAAFIIPNVTMYAIACGDNIQRNNIITEIKTILDRGTILERKVESCLSLKDREIEGEIDIFQEPMTIDNERVFHARCTQVIFSILESLWRILKLEKRKAFTRKRCIESGRSIRAETLSQLAPVLTEENRSALEYVLNEIPFKLISQVAFDSQSSIAALFYIEEALKQGTEQDLQNNLDYLQRIYVSLDDMDSVAGVSAVRLGEPASHELVLENIVEGKVAECMTKIEEMCQDEPNNLTVNYALVQTYLSVDEPKKAKDAIRALLVDKPEWEVALMDIQMETQMRLGSWSELKNSVQNLESFSENSILGEKCFSWNIGVAQMISKLQSREFEKVEEITRDFRDRLVAPLVAAAEEVNSYRKAYDIVVQLHILAEIEDACNLMHRHATPTNNRRKRNPEAALFQDVKQMVANWESRLMNVSPSRKILDQIWNVRRSILEIMKSAFISNQNLCEVLDCSIGECWLDIAKDSSRLGNFIRADKSMSHAKQLMSPKVFIQEAKILSRKGLQDSAISVLKKGIGQYFSEVDREEWRSQGEHSLVPVEIQSRKILCSKALLLLASMCEEQKLLDKQEIIDKYTEAGDVYKQSEKCFFTLASYFDRLWSKEKNSPAYRVAIADKNAENGEQAKSYYLQVRVVEYYSRSLLYGCKYVYQSLPRLLSIWFDHAATIKDSDFAKVDQSKKKVYATVKITGPVALHAMHIAIGQLQSKVPRFILMTAFSQLISRLCHANTSTWNLLKTIIVSIIKEHPYQTLWMTMAVSTSLNQVRNDRCKEIFKKCTTENPSLRETIKNYMDLTKCFLDFSNKTIDKELSQISLKTKFARLPNLIQGLGPVLVPFQIFMNPLLPQKGFKLTDHEPYPENLVYINSIEDRVDIMASMIRPKKLTLIASNGKRYSMLCKPSDDLRKDSKVMEVNSVVNWYLRQNAESSHRGLHVTTYSVIPLNEKCGLLEWVPNLMPFRSIISKLQRERGLKPLLNAIALTDSIELKVQKFRTVYLDNSPPVFEDWFFNNFPDHQSWYAARTTYIKTAAVMSMVGYIMGLGDRHGENILMDCVTGGVVHVDFNCLFDKGQNFMWPEKVPFRLTQNMVKAMGPLKYEGVFRRSCEVVMKMFREHQNVFLSVLRPFVYDPLVEWDANIANASTSTRHNKPQGYYEAIQAGEVTNEKAVETMSSILCRLNGTARNLKKEIDTELSVNAQVQHLIEEAVSIQNLACMFFGWAAYA